MTDTTKQIASFDPGRVLQDQVAAWTKERDRLQQLIDTATGRATPVSPAQSDPVFVNQLQEAIFAARSIDGREDYWNDVLARLGVTAPAKPHSDLHSAIMNLPCNAGRAIAMNGASMQAYKEGHRDARHAAAELVAAHFATAPSEGVAAPVEASDLHSFDTIRKAFDEQNEFYEFPSEDHRNGALNFFGWGWQAAAKLAASAQPSADQVRDAALEEAAEICDGLHHKWRWDNEPDSDSGPRSCAAAIRAKRTTASSEQSAGGFGGGARNSDGSFVISTGGGGARNSDGSFVISAAGGGVPGARGAGGEKGADRG